MRPWQINLQEYVRTHGVSLNLVLYASDEPRQVAPGPLLTEGNSQARARQFVIRDIPAPIRQIAIIWLITTAGWETRGLHPWIGVLSFGVSRICLLTPAAQ